MKIILPFLCLHFLSCVLLAEAPQPGNELRKTLSAAAQEKKLAFILLGRAACGNCNATKAMIRDGKIPVTASEYVMADLNIDDPKTEAEFSRKFRKAEFGQTLPFVVIADAQGKALVTTSGYKKPEEWNTLLTEAKGKAAGKGAGTGSPTGGKSGSNWPFNSPAKQ